MGRNTASNTQIDNLGQNCNEISERVNLISLTAASSRRFSKGVLRASMHLLSVIRDIRRLVSMSVQFCRPKGNPKSLLNVSNL